MYLPPSTAFRNLFIWCVLLLVAGTVHPAVASETRPPGTRPPEAAVEQNNIGVGYMNRFTFKQAAESFRRALELDPEFNLARINLGLALLYKQELPEAVRTFSEARARDSRNPHIYYGLGLTYKAMGESEPALKQFRRLLELDPDDAESYYNIGVLRGRQRRYQEAEAALRRALELKPWNTSILYNLGTILLRAGKREDGRAILERFRPLQQKGKSRSTLGFGSQYGEIGKYAFAMDYMPHFVRDGAPSQNGETHAPFADVSVAVGLNAFAVSGNQRRSLPVPFDRGEWGPDFLKSRLLPSVGGGIALMDLDNDGKVSVIVTRFNPDLEEWQTLLLRNDGRGTLTDISAESGLLNSGGHVSAAVGDFDNDELPDIYLVGLGGNRLFKNRGQGRFEDVTDETGVGGGGLALSATFLDYDHDGDLDLYVCQYADVSGVPSDERLLFPDSLPGAPNRIFRNNGNGTFTDQTDALQIGGGKRRSVGMIASDLDIDRDIDLLVVNSDGPPQIYRNDRDAGFEEITSSALSGLTDGYHSLTVVDVDRDGLMDLFLASSAGRPHVLLRNRDSIRMVPDTRSPDLLRAFAGGESYGTGTLDYDNDGDLDLYLLGKDETRSGTLWENLGDGEFNFAGELHSDGTSAACADFDGDGRTDILYLDTSGSPHLLKNETVNHNHWLGIRLAGRNSNRAGYGSRVELRSGYAFVKYEVQGHNGYLSQDSPIWWLGLGSAAKADTVTIRWPGGVLQSEINVVADRVVRIRELDRKGTSCPLLYTWAGERFEFVTDFLGGCAIGYLTAPGQYNFPDTDEYVRIEGSQLQPRNGKYLLNLANQLEEIIMFDQAQLLVVDHPAGTEIYPNERLMPAPPFPEFKIFTARAPQLPVSAVDDSGNDVLPLIAEKDRTYPSGFNLLPFKGYADGHAITLDLGPLAGAKKVVLIMDAWIDYADSTANLAASQAEVALIPPYLQVRGGTGEWQTVVPAMGFPAGLPKAMTVDLTDKFLTGDHHVRIVTNMRIYWDRIRVATSADEEVRITRLDPSAADLHFLGYPKYYTPDGNEPRIYDYSRIEPTEFWGTHGGSYTRYGDVRPLLLGRDDMYVITRHGDEITVSYDAESVPALEEGWVRDFLLYADGFGKDMDINALYPEIQGPLPFHGMSRYPYPSTEKYPDDESHRRYLEEYNTRIFPDPRGKAPITTGPRRKN